jgi:hypothetical protein
VVTSLTAEAPSPEKHAAFPAAA